MSGLKNMSSTLWIFVVIVGAFLVTLGNIQYNRARDYERAVAAGTKALSMLRAETANNLTKIQEMRAALGQGQIKIAGFEDTAWKIVSEGGLLAQVGQPTLARIADVYYKIGLLNGYHSRLLELLVGAPSALTQAAQHRQQIITVMQESMNEVEPLLREIGTEQAAKK